MAFTILIPMEGDGFPTLVARPPVREIEYLKMEQITRTAVHHTHFAFVDQLRSSQVLIEISTA